MTMDTNKFRAIGISMLGVFCISTLSFATPDQQMLTAKEKYKLEQLQEEGKYYDYLTAIAESGKVTPTQIKAIKAWKSAEDQAKNSRSPLKKDRQTVVYNDDQPPVVVIGNSRLSTITFVDNAGNPYPIQSYVVSDTQSFTVTQRNTDKSASVAVEDSQPLNTSAVDYDRYLTNQKGAETPKPKEKRKAKKTLPASMFNSLTVRGQSNYANGDLIVYLIGKQNAVHIFLESSDHQYDYQSNITVDGLTAMSLANISQTGEQVGRPNNTLMEFLNGTPPNSAQSMDITLPFSQVWALDTFFYIRTKSELQSPAYISRVSTATGYKIFKITNTTHVLSMVDHGQLKTVYINEPLLAEDLK
jgi:hypothetical protein